jgi:hypothetical protein
MEIIPDKNLLRVAAKEPSMINVIPGKIYSWCT